jgi:hypothetical protein
MRLPAQWLNTPACFSSRQLDVTITIRCSRCQNWSALVCDWTLTRYQSSFPKPLEFLVRSSQQPRSLHPKAIDSCLSLATGYLVSLVLVLSEVHTKNIQTIARFQPDIWLRF